MKDKLIEFWNRLDFGYAVHTDVVALGIGYEIKEKRLTVILLLLELHVQLV